MVAGSRPSSDVPPGGAMLSCAAVAAGHAVRAGHPAPTFRLQDQHGGSLALLDLIRERSLVISFYRGIWCGYCDTALEALARIDREIAALGARHVAIGPEPGGVAQRRRLEALPMPVLLDRGLLVSQAYGLTMTVPDALRRQHAEAGYVPPGTAEGARWLVPIPATYVIDRRGRVAMASIDIDYRKRLDPARLLAALRGLHRRRWA